MKSIIFGAVFTVVHVLLAASALTACGLAPNNATQIAAQPAAQIALVEPVSDPVDGDATISLRTEMVAPLESPSLDGLAILDSQCARCHAIPWFDLIEKSPAEWGEALEKMTEMGVQLSQAEKDVLINYLTALK